MSCFDGLIFYIFFLSFSKDGKNSVESVDLYDHCFMEMRLPHG
jgi:hypothetical protein